MTAYLRFFAFLILVGLSVEFTIGQSQQPMDEWVALDKSLKTSIPVHPKNGFVPDESTAVKIADAVAVAEYGENRIAKERPFRARLRGGIWTVMGTLPQQGALGGTAVVQVSKKDGTIVFMTHQY